MCLAKNTILVLIKAVTLYRKQSYDEMRPEEGLEIITHLMQDTRRRVLQRSAAPFVVWGWATVLMSIAVYCAVRYSGNAQWYKLWLAMPLIAWPVTSMLMPKKLAPATGISKSVSRIWAFMGVVTVGVSVASYFINFNVMAWIVLLLAIGCYVTGVLIRHTMLTYGAYAGVAASAAMWVIVGVSQLPLFAAAIALMMVLPGHAMLLELRRYQRGITADE